MRQLILICFWTVAFSVFGMAQSDNICPFGGKENCTGACGLFEDHNGDGFCDHGTVKAQPATTKPDSTKPHKTQKTQTTSTKTASTVHPTADTTNTTATEAAAITADTSATATSTNKHTNASKKPYSLILISVITLAAYALTAILVKTNKIKKITHRRIWNIILLITCLVSCLLGFFLVIQINYHVAMPALRTIRYYHVQFGIAMTIVAIIHILWHLTYFKTIFKKKA